MSAGPGAGVTTVAAGRAAPTRLRAIFGGSVGNLVEWFDWYVYSAFALYFARAFFPVGDQTAQLLDAAAVFAVGFFVRPCGGWLMGIYADRAGRRAALVLSMAAMGAGSLVIALPPGYARIGFAAPLILVLARVLQALSVGGEFSVCHPHHGAAPRPGGAAHRNCFSSPEALSEWSWRVPFAISACYALGGRWVMLGIEETSSFEAVKRRGAPVET